MYKCGWHKAAGGLYTYQTDRILPPVPCSRIAGTGGENRGLAGSDSRTQSWTSPLDLTADPAQQPKQASFTGGLLRYDVTTIDFLSVHASQQVAHPRHAISEPTPLHDYFQTGQSLTHNNTKQHTQYLHTVFAEHGAHSEVLADIPQVWHHAHPTVPIHVVDDLTKPKAMNLMT